MFIESAFIIREFREETIPILEKVTCLSVVNTGDTVAVVNGITVYPTQIQVLILADGTYSRVQLEVTFLEQGNIIIPDLSKEDKFFLESQNPKYYAPIVQKKILLIYKKLI